MTGFETPESVRYDPGADILFVSNIAGNPSGRDNNGFISRASGDGRMLAMRFIQGGRDGVMLNAPKGMAVTGDTLWVADIDAVRAFHRRTGAPLASIAVPGATFLNDVAVGADGALYVTDTGIVIDGAGRMAHPGRDQIFRVTGGTATAVAGGDAFALPNGIAADGDGFLLAPNGSRAVQRWRAGEGAPRDGASGPGGYDGIEVVGGGRALVTSWADSTVSLVDGGSVRPVIRGLNSPADLGVDPRRGWVAVPLFLENRVEIWALPPADGGRPARR
ncbi:MAG TPA: hypothetical protein VF665_15835 [Longimicrobium sp.]|uniref:SMP-30/gluconolactonase/LRE family protein n=1 Tax=Longimicrobium sp. TaxID=2029185 RepID=UPI002ED7C991